MFLDPCFEGLASLEELDLSGNLLQTIEASMFSGLGSGLVLLELSNNKVESLGEAAFTSLQRIRTLRLNNNLIKTVVSMH